MLAKPNENAEDNFLNYKFSPEEMKALDECNFESFVQRSLPLTTLCAAGAWYAVKSGIMKGSASYGAFPKMIVAGTIGYFVGKFSYRQKCAEKFMQIPDSKVGKMLRERQGKSKGSFGGFGGDFDPGFGSFSSSSSSTSGSSEQHGVIFNDISPRTFSDLDTDRPITNYDDSFSHNEFNHTNPDESLPSMPPSQLYTYDELRKKNREEYEQSKSKQYARPRYTTSAPAPSAASASVSSQEDFRTGEQPPSSPSPPPSWNKQRNIYGDVWEK